MSSWFIPSAGLVLVWIILLLLVVLWLIRYAVKNSEDVIVTGDPEAVIPANTLFMSTNGESFYSVSCAKVGPNGIVSVKVRRQKK